MAEDVKPNDLRNRGFCRVCEEFDYAIEVPNSIAPVPLTLPPVGTAPSSGG